MAAVTRIDKSYIAALGPLKVEFIFISVALSDGDTVTSALANPTYAAAVPIGDVGGTNNASASLSGKTVTIHDPHASADYLVMVFGDSVKSLTASA